MNIFIREGNCLEADPSWPDNIRKVMEKCLTDEERRANFFDIEDILTGSWSGELTVAILLRLKKKLKSNHSDPKTCDVCAAILSDHKFECYLPDDKSRSLWLLCAAASNISRLYMKTVIYFDRHLPEWHTIVHEPGVWAVLWNGNDHCVIKHLTRKKESTFTRVERYKEVSWLFCQCCCELVVLGDSVEFLLFNSRC